ncbi:2OG-Fe(II) oxygenase [Rhodomicrobium vannielii ATCC 17100]|uniref:2OG-Fe(II) oxygenase n=1 Tax=Rhodomicrobium vannielii TaxID=1069 RepID=UPI0019196600|nr:2OG-Fe(II) oxygenase [Rhodomicrobium vannielii]MBJ7532814.1 2OG-Fe(II) oxygenase [Rhodomicrobium vannielii ATCC 17100]
MTYPRLPEPSEVAEHFAAALSQPEIIEEPYRRWRILDCMPEAMCTGILTLPIAPPVVTIDTKGARDTFNNQRIFFTPKMRELFPAMSVLSDAMQSPTVARQFAETCHVDVEGAYLRMEYIQDLDGMWLEPHRDIKEKLFSMVIYLCTGPYAKDWGTDIYDHDKQWCGRGTAEFNSAVIFISGPHSWHGFEPRRIHGVRRLMEINYVSPTWRDKDQLAFPDRPISLG